MSFKTVSKAGCLSQLSDPDLTEQLQSAELSHSYLCGNSKDPHITSRPLNQNLSLIPAFPAFLLLGCRQDKWLLFAEEHHRSQLLQ